MAKELNFAEIKNFYSPLGQFPIKIETNFSDMRGPKPQSLTKSPII